MSSSGGYCAGKVDIGGKKRRIELIDENVNGTFNDQAAEMGDSDCVRVEGDKIDQRYLGKMLELDGQFYYIEVARDGAFIKLQKAEDVVLGQVHVPEAITEFVAFGVNGHFVRTPVKGEFALPVGGYRIQQWKIDRKDAKGTAWELRGNNFNDSARFEVASTKPVSLEVGEPVRLVMQVQEPPARPGARESARQVNFNLRFQGRYGELLDITQGGQRPRGPRLTLTSLDGTYRYTNTFEFG